MMRKRIYAFKAIACLCLILLISLFLCACSSYGGSSSNSGYSSSSNSNSDNTSSSSSNDNSSIDNNNSSSGSVIDTIIDSGGKIIDTVKEQGGKLFETAKSWSIEAYDKYKEKFIDWYGTAKDATIYVYDEAASVTKEAYAVASEKANALIGDAKDYISGLSDTSNTIRYAECDPDHLIKDLNSEQAFNLDGSRTLANNELEQFIAYYISSVLVARGYKVYNGAVYYKDNVYGGLIFTKEETFIEEDGNKILSCGFIQLVNENYNGVTVTDEMVETGLIAISTATCGEETKAFIVEEYAYFDSFSGIYKNKYFCYNQLDHYVMQIAIKDNKESNYDNTIELYDFDNNKEIYNIKSDYEDLIKLSANDEVSFQGAMTTANAIADIGEQDATGATSSVFIIDGDALSNIIGKAKSGSKAVVDFLANSAKNVKLKAGQFLEVKSDGKVTLFGDEDSVDEERITNGIITAVGSCLGLAGSVASIVCTVQGGAVVVSAIVITTGTMAIVYNVSNMIEGIDNIHYGSTNSDEDAKNPVLTAFKKYIKDEKTAETVYHCWGIGSTLITNLMMPVSKALKISKCKGLNTFQTSINVVRAAVVQCAKALATGIGAGIVSSYVSKVVTKVTNNESIGKLVGFGTALVSAMLIYKGLDSIDRKLNISGLYPKAEVMRSFQEERTNQKQERLKNIKKNYQRGETEEIVNDLVDQAVELYGIEERPQVRLVYDPDVYNCGTYYPGDNSIEINMRASTHQSLEGLADTIGHEMRHAQQYQYVATHPNSEMAYSLENYITPSQGYDAYRNQLCEQDAFNAGKAFVSLIFGVH